jgi:predicted phage terminase large subunit-like protein
MLDQIEAAVNAALERAPDEQEQRRQAARSGLIPFTEYTFPRFQTARHHHAIAQALEAVKRGEIDRLMIFAPPRHTKSELCSRRFPAWYLGRHPDRQIICCSYSDDLAVDLGRNVRDIVEGEEYRELFGTAIRPDSRAAERWQTTQGGIYIAAGVGSGITGRGAHVALIDDPVKNREEADSETFRKRVWDWFTDVLYTRLMPGGAIVIVMTRWHEDDLAGRLLEAQKQGGEQWEVLNLPALAREGDPLGRQPGEALWPEWYAVEALERIRTALTITSGPRSWTALYQGEPQAEEGDYFRREWIRWYDERPAHLRIYGASDYAVTASGGDYTVHGVAGVDPNDDLYVLDWWRMQASSDKWVEAAIDLMQKYRPAEWAEESGQIEKGVGPFLTKRMQERRVYCHREPYVSSSDKPTRAQSIRGRMSMGKVYFPRGAPWTDDLIGELLRFPAGVNDDQVDVLSLFGRILDKMIKPRPPKSLVRRGLTFNDLERMRTLRASGVWTREAPMSMNPRSAGPDEEEE